MNMQLQVLPDNDTSVIRGPVIKKTGWPRGQWSGANPPPECFPFSGVPGANYLAGVIRGVARFISVYEGEYSRERLVQQLARTHPKTITQLAQKDTGSSANRHMRQILRIYNGASREMSLPLKN